MAEDLLSYKVQLEQVEAALTLDPSNGELQKLRDDLKEIISLTKDMLESQLPASASSALDSEAPATAKEISSKWKVGDSCRAVWSEDGQWYDAIIDAITDDGMVAVTFEEYGNSDITKLSALRERLPKEKHSENTAPSHSADAEKSRKRQQEMRQLARKKKQKKFERQKQIEEAHEAEKAKWQAFTAKTKKLKGVTKKSIFATPDAVNGRVGIGTCGIGGKPMTEYTQAEKWRKGT